MNQILQLEHVTKTFHRGREQVVALHAADFAVSGGEVVGVIGRSGAGKSTLLHLAGGLDRPDAGRVLIDGEDIGAMTTRERAKLRRRKIGFVFQFFHLIPTLTVTENIELPLVLDAQRGTGATARQWVERVGLADRAEHLPGELSGGEMQRVAIARAMVTGPPLILADEPTGNLDSVTSIDILALLTDHVTASGAALVLVTHDDTVAAIAQRVVRLHDGNIVSTDAAHPSGSSAR